MALLGSSNSNDLPVPQVKALSDRGYAENDIKDILRKKGYSENEINLTLQKALVAKVSQKTSGLIPLEAPQAPAPQSQQPLLSPAPEHHELELHEDDTHALFGSIGAKQEDLSFDGPNLSAPPAHEEHRQDSYEVDLEPIVEAIVEEKWADSAHILADIQERLESLETITKGGTKLDEVAQVEYLAKQVQEKVDRLEHSLDEVTIKVNSIEKAFKQFIPSLTGNIKALSDAVRSIRAGDSQQ